MKAKHKLSYRTRKLANMRRAKAMRQPNRMQRELREEEHFRLGITDTQTT